jgi:hypothetical protein
MFPSARFIQTVAPFKGRGLLRPTALGTGTLVLDIGIVEVA